MSLNQILNPIVKETIIAEEIKFNKEWFVNLYVQSVKEPHDDLLHIRFFDDKNKLPKIDHFIEKNELTHILINNLIESKENLSKISGNTCVSDYRKNIVLTLYSLCLGNKEDIKESASKGIYFD